MRDESADKIPEMPFSEAAHIGRPAGPESFAGLKLQGWQEFRASQSRHTGFRRYPGILATRNLYEPLNLPDSCLRRDYTFQAIATHQLWSVNFQPVRMPRLQIIFQGRTRL